MKFTETLNAALAKVTFPSPELKASVDNLLTSHKADLSDVGYEPSTDTEDAIKEVNSALNDLDETAASRKEDLKEATRLAREESEQPTDEDQRT